MELTQPSRGGGNKNRGRNPTNLDGCSQQWTIFGGNSVSKTERRWWGKGVAGHVELGKTGSISFLPASIPTQTDSEDCCSKCRSKMGDSL